MRLEFSGVLWYWRGPSPYHFVSVPDEEAEEIHAVANFVTYGWGVIPATVVVGRTTWSTSLFPKEGGYVVPVKLAVRETEGLELDDEVHLVLEIDDRP